MKNINTNLKDLLVNDNLNLTKCFKITLSNKDILTFTEFSRDLNIENLTYKACNCFEENNNQNYSDITSGDDLVVAFIENINIKKDEVLSGKFDNALIEIFYIDYNYIGYGKIPLITGFIDKIQLIDNKIYLNISGTLNLLEKTIGETFSPLCRAKFCDKKCTLDINNYSFTGEISEIISDTEFCCTGTEIINKTTNYFKYGIIIFSSGKNKDKLIEIKQTNGNNIVLNTKLFYNIEIGDRFKIIAGCDKKFQTCIKKFNNAINFRGEPNLPRTTKVYKFY